ncbi:hypothetical protein GCM10009530_63560 [Microbispora corallina]|uniref:Uncharacterized protein n=1 Tax=Microbispora corallina TaxID=83302 RepID=A0ABQ4GBE4_9ACTN|nr:hypothetical protein [Microbispora corallina]GIH44414.1 hypothetical protein Mco01_74140 [Microbispora corallina]
MSRNTLTVFGPDGPPLWELIAHERERPSDSWFVECEPTGVVTFRCACGERVIDRADETVRQAREHLRTQHPDWDQIPDD